MTPKLINASFLQAVSIGDKDKVESILKDKRYDVCEYEALIVAIEYNHQQILHLLLKNTTVEKVKLQEILNVIVIVKPKWIEVIERLIDCGAEVGMKNTNGDTIIHVAFGNINSHDVIDVLLKRYLEKSKENIVNARGISLLHIACTRTDLSAVKKLLNDNPSTTINTTDSRSLYTPLHRAVKHNRHPIARYLIKRGADIYKADLNGSTPLHWALWHHDTQMVDLIISLDKRRENIVNKYGLSHFMAACIGSKADIVKNYLQALLDHPKFSIRDLIKSNVPKFGNYTGFTPLHFAVKFNCMAAVDFLLHYGADCCNAADGLLSPHLLAHLKGNERMERLLQEHCNLVKKCRVTRTQDSDFKKWGEDYEEHIVMEKVNTFKHLCDVYDNLNSIKLNDKRFDVIETCQTEVVSTDFQNDLDLFHD